MKAINVKSMSVDDLLTLRDRIDTVLSKRVAAERRDLETKLARLDRVGAVGGGAATRGRRGRKLGKVPPKYRNPDRPSETWAGRGRPPRWMTAAMKTGKKMEDFLIGGARSAKRKKARSR